jgi:hypothetical protein
LINPCTLQLIDMLEDVTASKQLFCGRYKLLGSVYQRLGGSAVVQFTTAANTSKELSATALKFHTKRPPFDRTLGLFADPKARALMPAVLDVVPNNDGQATGGVVLPPCVVMRKGESLEEWAARMKPNLPASLHALCQIVGLVKQLHEAGYVYYAVKPSNIAWYREEQCWALIDFGCAARAGALHAVLFARRRSRANSGALMCVHCTLFCDAVQRVKPLHDCAG